MNEYKSLADRLNRFEATAHGDRNGVTVHIEPNMTDLDADGNVANPELAELLEELDQADKYLDSHPEGSDRGGYVCFVEVDGETAFYHETANEWYAY